ncbi:hypothetical protein ACROYT_G020250 [Oculina patagonica]
MADLINFVSKRVIDAKKEEKRKAREQILKKAKDDYEREQRRKEQRIESGESSWMLPSLSKRLTVEDESNDKDKSKKKKHKKEKKQKKDRKEKKHKKQKKDITGEHVSSESESDDEWVEKGTDNSTTGEVESLSKPSQLQQRDSWMLCPPIASSSWEPMAVEEQEQEEIEEQEDKLKALSCLDQPGQHAKELNPYWRDGGTGLPSERDQSQETTQMRETSQSSFSSSWLKKAYQRAKDQAEEEKKSLSDIITKRYGSVEKLEQMIREAEEREAKQRKEVSKSTDRERYRSDRDRQDDRKRDRYERRNKERSPDRYDRHRARSPREKTCDSTYRSARDTEGDKWRRRDDEGRERVRNQPTAFLRPSDSNSSSSFAGKFKRPQSSSSSSSTVTSSTWDFDSKEESRSKERHSNDRPSSRPSGGWRKKQETESDTKASPQPAQHAGREEVAQEEKQESDTDSSSSSEEEVEEKKTVVIPAKKITEKDLNDIGAKIVKAEIMGNEELAIKLKSQLEEMRKNKELQEAQVKETGASQSAEEVILTRTDAAGNVWPLEMTERQEPRGGRRKRKKVETHGKEGERERYFADDDKYDLKEMVRREKMSSVADNHAMMAKLASKAAKASYSDDFTLDDRFVSSAANQISPAQQEQREKEKAIREHRLLAAQLSKCRFCFENPEIAKHLIIAIGLKVYLAVPLHESLTAGHCLIIPMQHCSSSTALDEDVWSEIQLFYHPRNGLDIDEQTLFRRTVHNSSESQHPTQKMMMLEKHLRQS